MRAGKGKICEIFTIILLIILTSIYFYAKNETIKRKFDCSYSFIVLIEVRTISILRSVRKMYQFFVDIPIKDGTVLKDRYHVISFIGAGSYGIVYLCRDLTSAK